MTPMNEPAHLAGLFGPSAADSPFPQEDSFVPPLPEDLTGGFLAKLNSEEKFPDDGEDVATVSDGNHLRVLLWLSDAIETFRSSSLPSSGVQLQVNVHESLLAPSTVPESDKHGKGGRAHPPGTAMLAAWWRGVTNRDERTTWAVLDMHRYHAWAPSCQGTVTGPPSGNYTCLDETARSKTLEGCSTWAEEYRDAVDAQVGHAGSKLLSGEFSASTHHSVRESCVDAATLRQSYLTQVEAAKAADVDLIWWSWKMPYGGAFREAWSFKQFQHRMGAEGFERPDEMPFECGEGFGA